MGSSLSNEPPSNSLKKHFVLFWLTQGNRFPFFLLRTATIKEAEPFIADIDNYSTNYIAMQGLVNISNIKVLQFKSLVIESVWIMEN